MDELQSAKKETNKSLIVRNNYLNSSHSISSLCVGPSLHQEPDHLHIALSDCHNKRSEPILQGRMDDKGTVFLITLESHT